MNTFRELITSLCLAGIGTAIYKMLVPGGAFEKQLKLLISLFFVFGMISPFMDGDINLSIPAEGSLVASSEYESLTKSIYAQLEAQTEANLARELSSMLAAKGVEAKEISAGVNIAEDYSISINEIRLVLLSPNDRSYAEELVRGEVGEKVLVTVQTAEEESNGE